MDAREERLRATANHARYLPGQTAGHYESFFQRANHPERPLAFWIRYTVFSPHGRAQEAVGELWAVFFDGETGEHLAARQEWPIDRCGFRRDAFSVRIGDSRLESGVLTGGAASAGRSLSWDLTYEGEEAPLFLLEPARYEGRWPRAKSLVGLPQARYSGFIFVDGNAIDVVDWVGSQNHNWGSRHTDQYCWGQVAGFDGHPGTFLEVATARLRLGPFWLPQMTPLVLRHNGVEYALNGLRRARRAQARRDGFVWEFRSEDEAIRLAGRLAAPAESFVALPYRNPPGGVKHCLNTKIASCELTVTDRKSGRSESLSTANRAAFEILTDDTSHGIPLAVD